MVKVRKMIPEQVSTPQDRLKEIMGEIIDTTQVQKLYYLALKSVGGETTNIRDLGKMRAAIKLVALALGFDYEDVVKELAYYHTTKMASAQLFREFKSEENSSIALAKGGKTIVNAIHALRKFSDVRRPHVFEVDINKLDEELDDLPF